MLPCYLSDTNYLRLEKLTMSEGSKDLMCPDCGEPMTPITYKSMWGPGSAVACFNCEIIRDDEE